MDRATLLLVSLHLLPQVVVPTKYWRHLCASEPTLLRFDTFSRGRQSINSFNYQFLLKDNENLYISFTAN